MHFFGLLLIPFCLFSNTVSSNQVPDATFSDIGNCAQGRDANCASGYTAKTSGLSSVTTDSTATTENKKLSIELALSEENPKSFALVYRELNRLVRGKRYRISAWVKADKFLGESFFFVSSNPTTISGTLNKSNTIASVPTVRSNSSWVQINLDFTTPVTEKRLYVGLLVQAQSNQCSGTACGTVHFDKIAVKQLADFENESPQFGNVCEDQEFLNLLTETCQNLDKNYGHSEEVIHTNTRYLNCHEISSDQINSAIKAFGKSGGTLLLAPCKAALTDDVELTSNITLRGAGVGRTVLFRSKNWESEAGTLIRLRGNTGNPIENIVLTDLTIQGSAPEESQMNNIQIRFTNNVLIERIETRNAGKSGISVRSSQQVTIRYITAHGSLKWHGIESKDCYIDASLDGDDEDFLISRGECAYSIPNFYTENIAIYSNLLFNNTQYGIDSHASFVEVAGNRSVHNGYASKFPEPAHNVWIHNNEFSMSGYSGIKIALQYKLGDETLVPHNQAIYSNLFVGNGGYGVRIHERAHDIYLIDNKYRQNGNDDKLRVVNGNNLGERVYICANDGSYHKGVDGHSGTYKRLAKTNIKCALDSINDIFSDNY